MRGGAEGRKGGGGGGESGGGGGCEWARWGVGGGGVG